MSYLALFSLFGFAVSSAIIPIPTEFPLISLIRHGESAAIVFAILLAGSVIGSVIGYCIGRYGFTKLRVFQFHNKRHEEQVRGWFQKYGEAFILVSPWIPVAGDLVPIVVGIENYDAGKFLLYTTVAKAIKAAVTILVIIKALHYI